MCVSRHVGQHHIILFCVLCTHTYTRVFAALHSSPCVYSQTDRKYLSRSVGKIGGGCCLQVRGIVEDGGAIDCGPTGVDLSQRHWRGQQQGCSGPNTQKMGVSGHTCCTQHPAHIHTHTHTHMKKKICIGVRLLWRHRPRLTHRAMSTVTAWTVLPRMVKASFRSHPLAHPHAYRRQRSAFHSVCDCPCVSLLTSHAGAPSTAILVMMRVRARESRTVLIQTQQNLCTS